MTPLLPYLILIGGKLEQNRKNAFRLQWLLQKLVQELSGSKAIIYPFLGLRKGFPS